VQAGRHRRQPPRDHAAVLTPTRHSPTRKAPIR
jgi:hypothetical protein